MTEDAPNGTLMRHAVSSDGRWLAGTEFRTGLQNGEPIHVWDTQKGERRQVRLPTFVGRWRSQSRVSSLVAHGQGTATSFGTSSRAKQLHRFGNNGEAFYNKCLARRLALLAGDSETSGVPPTTIALWNTALGKREYLFGAGKGEHPEAHAGHLAR